MDDDRPWESGPNDLVIPFVFVPHGAPEPTEWMAEHPGWVRFPASMVLRGTAPPSDDKTLPPTAVVSTAAEATPGATPGAGAALDGLGEGLAKFLGSAMAEAVAAAAAAGAVLFYPSQTAPREIDEAHPYPRQEPGHETTEGFSAAPPTRPLPGLEPPAELPPHEGLAPTSPLQGSPGLAPAPPLPALPPGRPLEDPAPTTLHQDRNEDLKGGPRTSSQRARDAARQADPIVSQALQDAEWRAHHLINMAAIRNAPDLLAEAARAGWRTDDASSIAPLPATKDAQHKLDSAGISRPVHDSGHRVWNNEVEQELRTIGRQLRTEGLDRGIDAYARRARELLEELQIRLRSKLLKSSRVTQNDIATSPDAV